jgi:hypothetical protein
MGFVVGTLVVNCWPAVIGKGTSAGLSDARRAVKRNFVTKRTVRDERRAATQRQATPRYATATAVGAVRLSRDSRVCSCPKIRDRLRINLISIPRDSNSLAITVAAIRIAAHQ